MVASQFAHVEVVKLLIAAGADMQMQDRVSDQICMVVHALCCISGLRYVVLPARALPCWEDHIENGLRKVS